MPDSELPPQTAPESISVNLHGFQDEQHARELGHAVANCIREISRVIDAERLDGVTIAHDYDAALAGLDRGSETLRPLTRSANEHAVGVAMAAPVLRNGVVKGHIVIHAAIAQTILDPEQEACRRSLYLLAHELGHVHDLKQKDLAFPGTLLRQSHTDAYDTYLMPMVDACWDEYAATKLSAAFLEEHTKDYEETFLSALEVAKANVDAAIAAYRWHADLESLLGEAIGTYGSLMKYAAYLLGHTAGLGGELSVHAPETVRRVSGSYFEPTFAELSAALNSMWENYGRWESRSIYDDLKSVCLRCLERGGLVLRRLPGGEQIHVDVPFSTPRHKSGQ